MRERLLISTAIGLMLGTGAFAQSPSEQPKTNSPPAAQSQTNSAAPAASSSTSSSPNPASSTSSAPSAQNTQSTPSGNSTTTTSQSNPPSSQSASPSQAQPGNNTTTSPSQAQSTQPSNSPAQAQTNTAPPANNQSQTSPTGPANANSNTGAQPSTNTAAQPSNNQTNTAQSGSAKISVSASLNEGQRTRVIESFARLNMAPVNKVNFSVSVGGVVPRDLRFQPLPAEVVEVMPQYRGYNFLVVRDDIVIVDPSTYQIVDVLPRGGSSTAAAPAPRKSTFSDRDREVIRKHARSSRTEQRTTGSSATSTRVRVGDRLPDSVEVRSFSDDAYRDSPRLREYRYIERDNRTYVVEPRERTIIEEIE